DKSKQTVYADSALLMYGLRIKYFNEEADVLNRKAYEAYKYSKDNSAKYDELLTMFTKTFGLNGTDVLAVNTIAYMDVIRRAKLSGGTMTDEEILADYDIISKAIDARIAENNSATYVGYKDKIDAMLSEIVTVDCAFIENNLGPKLKSNPDDLGNAKKIISLSLNGKCTDSPLVMEAAKIVHKKEPNYAIARVIALRAKADNDF